MKLLSGKKILFRVAPVPNHASLPSVIYYTWRGLFSEFYGICIFDKKVTPRSSLIHSGEKASEYGMWGARVLIKNRWISPSFCTLPDILSPLLMTDFG